MEIKMDPWQSIPTPEKNKISLKRETEIGNPSHKFFYSKDAQNNHLFIFKGGFIEPKNSVSGTVKIKLEKQLDPNDQVPMLIFKLLDIELKSQFISLTIDLMRTAQIEVPRDDVQSTLVSILNRFKLWKSMLGKSPKNILSDNEILGLYGELIIFKEYFLSQLEITDAINCWRGPKQDEQDFIFSSSLLEVKSQFSSSDSKISISSENQLDDISGTIYLCHQRFSTSEAAVPKSQTLNQIVHDITKLVSHSPESLQQLRDLLKEAKYTIPIKEYEKLTFLRDQITFYKVGTEFPRIIAKMLAAGISAVRYSLTLAHCSDFIISHDNFRSAFFLELDNNKKVAKNAISGTDSGQANV